MAPTPPTARPRAAETILALALFAGYAVFFYRDVLLADRVYVFRDLYTLYYSNEHVARLLATWSWPPQWTPFAVLGRPFAADPITTVWYPPHWLLRLLPPALGFNLSLVLHHTIAAWGAYLLGRHFTLSAMAALLFGLLYGFGGPFVSCDNLYNGVLAGTWAPWALLAFARWCERPSLAAFAATALALSLSVLASLPEFTLFTNVVLAALAIQRPLPAPPPAAGGGATLPAHLALAGGGRTRAVVQALLALAAANALALGLCAVQLVPSAELIAQSSRAAGLNVANALQHSLRPDGLLSFLWANRLAATPERWGATVIPAGDAPWLLTLYFGPVLLLALVGAALPERGGDPAGYAGPTGRPAPSAARRAWIVLGLGFLALALGENLPGYAWTIEHVPALRVVRYPEKFLITVHGLSAFAVGLGLDRLGRGRARWATAAVLVFAAADLYRANSALLPTAPWSEVAAPPASVASMDPGDDPLRIYGNAVNLPALPPYPEGFALEKDLLLMSTSGLYGIANLNAPLTINLSAHEALAVLIENVGRERVARLLGSLDTAYVTSARALAYPGLDLVRAPATALDAYVYRVAPLAPRAYVPRRVRVVDSAEAALATLRTVESPADEVAIEASGAPKGLPGEIDGDVQLVRYLPERVELRAAMRTPGWVVLGDTFYEGWEAASDGVPLPIVRANHFTRAVYLTAGAHDVAFEYRPRLYRVGLALSGSSLVLLAWLLWVDRRRPTLA